MFDHDSVSSTSLLVQTNVTPNLVPCAPLLVQNPTPRPQKETLKVGEERACSPSPETVEPAPEIQSTTSHVSSEPAGTNSTPSTDAEYQEDLQEPAWLPTSTV
jgi:hypothetical protein